MAVNGAFPRERMLAATICLPQHVVFRVFPAETVVLNLDTGKYHSLNPTGGHFLEVLQQGGSVGDGLARLQAEFADEDPAVVESDLLEFCVDLSARGLVEVREP